MNITVIITASPVPSHPRFTMIKNVVNSLSFAKWNGKGAHKAVPIILAHDGILRDELLGTREEKKADRHVAEWDYQQYLKSLGRWAEKHDNIEVAVRPDYGNLIGNVTYALEHVKTKYVMIVQHDLPFVRRFDLSGVVEDMELHEAMKHVRFNLKHNNSAYNERFDGKDKALFGTTLKARNNTYTMTCAWSDNNHVAAASYYRDVILPECGGAKSYMEHIINPKSTVETHEHYGTYIYGHSKHPPMLKHLHGRLNTGV